MVKYPIAEHFLSINGEGQHAGKLAIFFRLQGCNLGCSYCDTKWANEADCTVEWMTEDDIYERVKKEKVAHVTITGGEPLIQENIVKLLATLSADENISVEVETNGSVPVSSFQKSLPKVQFTTDYKLPSSGMEDAMCMENLRTLRPIDTLKCVCGTTQDLERVKQLLDCNAIGQEVPVYLSPVFDKIEPSAIVDFMKKHLKEYPQVRLQLQLHKLIWPTQQKGV